MIYYLRPQGPTPLWPKLLGGEKKAPEFGFTKSPCLLVVHSQENVDVSSPFVIDARIPFGPPPFTQEIPTFRTVLGMFNVVVWLHW